MPEDKMAEKAQAEQLLALARAFHDGPLMAGDHAFDAEGEQGKWCLDVARFFSGQRPAPVAAAPAAPPKAIRMPKLTESLDHRLSHMNGADAYRKGWNAAVRAMRRAALAESATGAAAQVKAEDPALPTRHADPDRNRALNSCSSDLETIINGHDPEIHHLGNRVWDRLDALAVELEEIALRRMRGDAAMQPDCVALSVWYGEMPESNGRRNWTASLHRKGGEKHLDAFCFARSEYPDRVRYEADRMRWVIGELAERPDILAYDADLHSGYQEAKV